MIGWVEDLGFWRIEKYGEIVLVVSWDQQVVYTLQRNPWTWRVALLIPFKSRRHFAVLEVFLAPFKDAMEHQVLYVHAMRHSTVKWSSKRRMRIRKYRFSMLAVIVSYQEQISYSSYDEPLYSLSLSLDFAMFLCLTWIAYLFNLLFTSRLQLVNRQIPINSR